MKHVIYLVMAVMMSLGAYALIDATMKERAAEAAHTEQVARCAQATALMLAEFDAIVGAGKFPTQDQQDRWVHLTSGCNS